MLRAVCLGAIGILFAAVDAAPAAAQPDVDRNCRDDRGVDRCAEGQHRQVLELFGIRPIEEHEAAGDQVRRVFYVDGYGRDLVAIAFVRALGREPMLWVHFPRREGEAPREPLTAAVPQRVWEDILFRSEMFGRELVAEPEPPAPPGERSIRICMHSWVYTVEASDPASPADSLPARSRREIEDACEDGLAQVFALEVQRAALPLLPACAALDPDQHRNEASMLAACALLHGDRMAAAEVMNRADDLRHAGSPTDFDMIAGLFDYRSTVDWNGERNGGDSSSGGQARFWLAKMSEPHTNFYVERIEGLSPYRVRLTGILVRRMEGAGEDEIVQRARLEQIWAYGPIREFQIESIVVGPFAPVPND